LTYVSLISLPYEQRQAMPATATTKPQRCSLFAAASLFAHLSLSLYL
jgi:hypothetical protein